MPSGGSSSAVPAQRSWPRRLLGRLPTVLWLTAMWVILWGDPSPGTVIAGLLVGSACYSAAKLPHIPVRLGFRPLAALRLVAVIGYDLFASSAQVALHVLWRPHRTRGAIVAVPMRTDSDFLLAMLSGGLSLVTGSLVIELNRDQGVVYVHGIPIDSPEAAERLRRQVRRTEELFVRAFGTAEDLAEFERHAEPADGEDGGDRRPGGDS
ncbi:Na+/H+ antiporter subunit E [Marinitenerispora sediminis]|uniref:Na+/H+ antiporter subunit E n=1 Tax=Marinitenerispora sediminis TaxID=1931232 RepID=A0A368TAW3_9ACTN|nr:Na+/H+ antiporter subunit E [Marinitenerispora sediminis]RCV60206.1 Na+/H+ antiporter subunit E [Marinitenerispora sediminis]RCV62131.1 Na+/H+ antiporter subunit E [Marinitenerispora sediminis]